MGSAGTVAAAYCDSDDSHVRPAPLPIVGAAADWTYVVSGLVVVTVVVSVVVSRPSPRVVVFVAIAVLATVCMILAQ